MLDSFVCLDGEFVGAGPYGADHMLARVSIVRPASLGGNDVLFDSYVAPTGPVTDYRTWVSGIRPENLENAPSFDQVRYQVATHLYGKVLVGHAVHNDLDVRRLASTLQQSA